MRRLLSSICCLAVLALLASTSGCASQGGQRYPDDIVWHDDDRHPISKPEEQWFPKFWRAADYTAFRPLSHFFLFEVPGRAANANALGEVPNSSWYTNRLTVRDLTTDEIKRGPCEKMEMEPGQNWTIQSGKIGGANPGFVVESEETGQAFLFKFDSEVQTERATAADVVGSRAYWAAGFGAPCNRIFYFDPELIRLADDATRETDTGGEVPMTPEDVKFAMRHAPTDDAGRVRTMASKFLPGEPLGPFSYAGTRGDDPNDVIPHEDRRELRGSRLIAAWLNHFDSRSQNTFTSFIRGENEERGYVRHFMLDFGDCLGSRWPWDAMTRRLGNAYYFDIGFILADLLTLGTIVRPWDTARTHEGAEIFGYFNVANFEVEEWKPGIPNPAFDRMDAEDAYWATKIISRFSDADVAGIVELAKFSNPEHARYLTRTLIGRRDKIVRHYSRQTSALDYPRTRGMEVCFEDWMVTGGYEELDDSYYLFWSQGERFRPDRLEESGPCIDLTERASDDYVVVEARARRTDQRDFAGPARFHFRIDGDQLRLVGIERRQ